MTQTASQVQQVWAALARSRLFGQEEFNKVVQRWQNLAIDPGNARGLLAWLGECGYLTEYQANLVGEGRVDNFYIKHYRILERIGKGRMAGVFKAVGPQGQVVAIKVLPPSRAKDPEMLARFQRESQLAARLNHHSVVKTIEFGQSRDLHFLVMEHLDGETVEEVLKQRKTFLPREAARIGFLVALGLQHIHEQGMVHRDLKPANLMLTPKPVPYEQTLKSMVKILDIGLGRTLFNPEDRTGQGELTNDGTLLGTPDYLAPEQARDPRRADIRADLYSLGCMLYHFLAGEPPFADENLMRQLLRHATQQPTPLTERNPAVSDALSQVVSVMMAKDPAQRYPTPGAAAEALKALLASG